MKITALLVLKPSNSGAGSSSSGGGSGPEAVVLADATDASHFGYFQRSAAREFIVFIAEPSRSAPSGASGSPSSTKNTRSIHTQQKWSLCGGIHGRSLSNHYSRDSAHVIAFCLGRLTNYRYSLPVKRGSAWCCCSWIHTQVGITSGHRVICYLIFISA
ncbi:hypothetical protein PAHAL_8G210000 [Panicum hallii]|uniref:Longin domain-containing protein n=1 Tax=Panicum hallii TaxID=206008 RepID=A0A2S3IES8_9POAL|nr:hypothetical protein PAHAL_8G210000 [Panicum hallii]